VTRRAVAGLKRPTCFSDGEGSVGRANSPTPLFVVPWIRALRTGLRARRLRRAGAASPPLAFLSCARDGRPVRVSTPHMKRAALSRREHAQARDMVDKVGHTRPRAGCGCEWVVASATRGRAYRSVGVVPIPIPVPVPAIRLRGVALGRGGQRCVFVVPARALGVPDGRSPRRLSCATFAPASDRLVRRRTFHFDQLRVRLVRRRLGGAALHRNCTKEW
jgi:hypothetical protein